tara:strand:+ start:1473 stop:1748 length:276 start_codon:yes stop_codon:yes gene_type:complete
MSGLTFQQHEALRRLNANIVTISGTVATDKDDNVITYDLDAVNAEVEAKAYQEKRKLEYPAIANQLDDLYHNGIDGWKTTIKAIKDKHPKE